MKPWTIDAHCHWADPRVNAQAEIEIPRLIELGVRGFQLAGVDPQDWQRQKQLQQRFPKNVWCAFGLHPYFVAQSPRATLEKAFEQLTSEAPTLHALGEMGLDFRQPYVQTGPQIQSEFFSRQLDLAAHLQRPVILHIVRAHEEALKILKSQPHLKGMVHAFTGHSQVAKRYLDLGLYLSIGSKLLFPTSQDLMENVRQMPLERLLLESDSPDQPPPGQTSHDSATVFAVAERVSRIKGLPLAQVLEQTRRNFFTLVNLEPAL